MIRKGEVRVNKGRTKAAYKLIEGDIVRIPARQRASRALRARRQNRSKSAWILRHILHEDDMDPAGTG